MNVRLDPARLSVGADSVEARAADMAARRAEIEASVDTLLAGWRGDAAERFAGLWEEWRAGADAVISSLSSSAVALRAARDDVWSADDSCSEAHDLLARRLG